MTATPHAPTPAAPPSAWDLTVLLDALGQAADRRACLPQRNLWVIRSLEWLRHAPLPAAENHGDAAPSSPQPALRLQHLLDELDRHPEQRDQAAAVLGRFWAEMDTAALFADFGFSSRANFFGELGQRLKRKLLPITPATTDLSELFGLLFPDADDALWLESLDEAMLDRLRRLMPPDAVGDHAWQIVTRYGQYKGQ